MFAVHLLREKWQSLRGEWLHEPWRFNNQLAAADKRCKIIIIVVGCRYSNCPITDAVFSPFFRIATVPPIRIHCKRKNVVKKITLAWYFILKLYTFLYILRMSLLHFFFFSFVFLFFVNFVFIRYLWITIFLLNKSVIVRKRSFFHKYKEK